MKFYWSLRDLDKTVEPDEFVRDGLVGQLIWREYFYTMCMNNPNFHKMLGNPICLNIDWIQDDEMLEAWTKGRTGFPLIDAAMRQLLQEGWIHHVARNSVACFLTRGDLWISWEEGLKVFLKYLVDADLPVCAGNWMWVSSSAFEVVLQSSLCISPTSYLRRFEPSGQYIKKYVKELSNMPGEYLFEPWLAPLEVQKSAGCILGKDYPLPIVEHQAASEKNSEKMDSVKAMFLPTSIPVHYAPSNSSEACVFLWLPENCLDSLS
ncbi:cryptochrome-1-like [Uloborus diversus]|uniref:cryptochrome-1-like n=1 Tax=Uloborus diversus TaxID=327109 RepID=UPI00240A403F|nr:cryptochrome-1-like [Uloborus diversus]